MWMDAWRVCGRRARQCTKQQAQAAAEWEAGVPPESSDQARACRCAADAGLLSWNTIRRSVCVQLEGRSS